MKDNPYQAPKEPSEPHRGLSAQYPWLTPLVGYVAGLATGPICWVLLVVSMHEDHDPPLAQEFSKAWYGIFPITFIVGFVGAWLGLVWTATVGRRLNP